MVTERWRDFYLNIKSIFLELGHSKRINHFFYWNYWYHLSIADQKNVFSLPYKSYHKKAWDFAGQFISWSFSFLEIRPK